MFDQFQPGPSNRLFWHPNRWFLGTCGMVKEWFPYVSVLSRVLPPDSWVGLLESCQASPGPNLASQECTRMWHLRWLGTPTPRGPRLRIKAVIESDRDHT